MALDSVPASSSQSDREGQAMWPNSFTEHERSRDRPTLPSTEFGAFGKFSRDDLANFSQTFLASCLLASPFYTVRPRPEAGGRPKDRPPRGVLRTV